MCLIASSVLFSTYNDSNPNRRPARRQWVRRFLEAHRTPRKTQTTRRHANKPVRRNATDPAARHALEHSGCVANAARDIGRFHFGGDRSDRSVQSHSRVPNILRYRCRVRGRCDFAHYYHELRHPLLACGVNENNAVRPQGQSLRWAR